MLIESGRSPGRTSLDENPTDNEGWNAWGFRLEGASLEMAQINQKRTRRRTWRKAGASYAREEVS
jgi:hypothetical protein